MTKVPEGVACNNPFDLMDQGIKWLGRTGSYRGIVKFKSPVDGVRAGMIDARSKVYHDGLDTPNLFLNKFAPPAQNNTLAYIDFMCKKIGIGATDKIDLSTPAKCVAWAKAISEQEVGLNPKTRLPWFPDSVYEAAAANVFGLASPLPTPV